MKEKDCNVEEDEEKLEMSDIRRSSLSQLTREGDLDRVRRFLDFTGDQSLKRINKLDESKVYSRQFWLNGRLAKGGLMAVII